MARTGTVIASCQGRRCVYRLFHLRRSCAVRFARSRQRNDYLDLTASRVGAVGGIQEVKDARGLKLPAMPVHLPRCDTTQ